jgi:protein phosphatase
MEIELGGSSRRGGAGPVNEDALFYPGGPGAAITPTQITAHGRLLLVADGQGGDAAAEIVRELAAHYYAQVGANAAENLRRAIHETNARVFEQRKETQGHQAGTGATLVAVILKHDLLVVANIGTCRAYLLRAGRCWPLTRDHVREDGSPSRRMAISPYLDPDIFLPLALADGDRVLLCSDGVSAAINDEAEWVRAAGRSTPAASAEALIAAALAAGSQEDMSVIAATVKASRPEGRLSRGQQAVVLLLGLLALFLLTWFSLELWWFFTA